MLAHVSAPKNIFGNEKADILAKEGTRRKEIGTTLPVPSSYIKNKDKILPAWQICFKNSQNGSHTCNLIPKVSLKFYNLSIPTTAFRTGHGLFRKYLYYENIVENDLCQCGEVGTPFHCYLTCQDTREWHIKKPKILPSNWLTFIFSYPLLIEKLKQMHYHQINVSNLTN